MNEWRQVKLGDIADEVTVGHVGSMAQEYRASGVPLLRSQNVVPHGFDLKDVKYIDSEFHRRLKKSALKAGDVVTVRTGKPGATAVVPADWDHANCSDLVITRPGNEINPHWLSYYINSAATGYIGSQLVGAVQQHFNVGAAKNMTLNLPPLPEQQAIAEVLSALDDKVAANTKLAAVATQLMLSLASTFKPSVPLGEVAVHKRKSVSPHVLRVPRVAHYSLPAYDAVELPDISVPADIKSSKFLIERPSVLISKLNPRFPRVWNVADVPAIPALASTEFLVLESPFTTTTLLWALLRQEAFGFELESKVAGTSGSHQRVKPADLLATQVADPRSIGSVLTDKITSLGESSFNARLENETLAATRDVLLPQLMSGKLRVKEAEKVMENAGV